MEELAAGDAGPQVYDLADALVADDLRATLALAEELAVRDEPPGRLVWRIVDRLREVHRAAELLEAGVPEKDIAGALRQPPWLAKKTMAKARKADRATLGAGALRVRRPRGRAARRRRARRGDRLLAGAGRGRWADG